MPKASVVAVWASLLVLGCAAEGPRAPREILTRSADQATQYVEQTVSPNEVAETIQAMIAAEPVCQSWPTLWIEEAGRRTLFRVRYDLMRRDWGASVADASLARMEEFVASGFLTRRERPDLGEGAVDYELTPAGARVMQGSPYSGQRPHFCGPAERRLVAITAMEWGQFACGNLRVRFSHVSDEWPSWAQAEATRARLAAQWPPIGYVAEGTVSLSRQWYTERDRPRGVRNGALGSICYDQNRVRIEGDDLELFADQPEPSPEMR